MLRQLTEKDREIALAFAGDCPSENIFILGDIEAFGFEDKKVTVWGAFNDSGEMTSLLLRYNGNFIPYARDVSKLNGQEWAELIYQDGRLETLSGLKTVVERILPYIKQTLREKKTAYYAKRNFEAPLDLTASRRRDIRMLFPEETDKIVQLRASIPEFSKIEQSQESFRENMEKGISRTFYIEKNGEPVSAVSTTAETRGAAMIVGVCTKKGYEQQGYATSCLVKTLAALKAEHKEACLVYDNPVAGKMYKKYGFTDIDKWVMAVYQKKNNGLRE
ncbi:GNAT family N-acetyltransferase [Sporolactobacillus sp. THM7-4]|nr:GNAT family N-acetyltransferase [Sporolactobacillus sp. THM7-4]